MEYYNAKPKLKKFMQAYGREYFLRTLQSN